jgi:glutamate/tyrosine decarboxylase-like PLP-dependent enzyme
MTSVGSNVRHFARQGAEEVTAAAEGQRDEETGNTGKFGIVTSLFPAPGDRVQHDDRLTRLLVDSNVRVAEGAVVPRFDLEAFRRNLAEFSFEAPRPVSEMLSWVIAELERGVVHVNHPRYFGLFNPAPTFPAQCADRIAASFNPQLATSTTSPVAIEIESHVIRHVAQRAGLPLAATGHFTTGGAEANLTALICALTSANPHFAAKGARAFEGPPTFYISRDSHLAWLKIAHQTGVGRSGVRQIATDGSGRMDLGSLSDAVRSDRACGCIPVMVVATAGTTNAGMIDPLIACAETARREGMWHHVDAAWGGAAIVSDRLSGLLAGVEKADSITIDAHKWLATTMGCGMFITKHASMLSSAFHVSTTYMPSNHHNLDPYVTSVQWSRRFLGLRLFLSLAAAGWTGYATHVERSIALADLLAHKLRAAGWSIINDPRLAVLCVLPPAGSNNVRDIVAQVLASGRGWISTAMFEERQIIRACITSGETTENDIEELAEALVTASQNVMVVA